MFHLNILGSGTMIYIAYMTNSEGFIAVSCFGNQ